MGGYKNGASAHGAVGRHVPANLPKVRRAARKSKKHPCPAKVGLTGSRSALTLPSRPLRQPTFLGQHPSSWLFFGRRQRDTGYLLNFQLIGRQRLRVQGDWHLSSDMGLISHHRCGALSNTIAHNMRWVPAKHQKAIRSPGTLRAVG